MIGDSFVPTIDEALAAVREAAYPISVKCPTCHEGTVETGQVGVWAGYEQIPLDKITSAIEAGPRMEWYHGLPYWVLTVEDFETLRIEPPSERLRQFELQHARERLAKLESDT